MGALPTYDERPALLVAAVRTTSQLRTAAGASGATNSRPG
jgi:hypothetical protein